jgi:hypothetical protein
VARNIGADGRTVYRAVITFGDSPTPRYEGPYGTAGTARARVSFWRSYLARNGSSATGRVEQAHTLWTPVGEAVDPIAAARAAGIREAADAIDNSDTCDCGGCTPCVLRAHAEALRRRADQIHPVEEPTR